MPEEIELADGTKRTVPTEEELKELQSSQETLKQKDEQLNKFNELLGLDEGQSYEDKIQELKDSANPNWQKMRKSYNEMKKTLKDKGVEIDDDTGQIKTNTNNLTEERVAEIIKENLSSFKQESTSANALSKFNEEDKEKIQPVFNKLMELGGSIEENLSLAEAKVFPGRDTNTAKNAFNNADGSGAPAGGGSNDTFDTTGEGETVAKAMNLSFSKKDSK